MIKSNIFLLPSPLCKNATINQLLVNSQNKTVELNRQKLEISRLNQETETLKENIGKTNHYYSLYTTEQANLRKACNDNATLKANLSVSERQINYLVHERVDEVERQKLEISKLSRESEHWKELQHSEFRTILDHLKDCLETEQVPSYICVYFNLMKDCQT